jgi:hypothetical protein
MLMYVINKIAQGLDTSINIKDTLMINISYKKHSSLNKKQ